MISRHHLSLHALACAVLLLSLRPAGVSAQDVFDCKITLNENHWDLTSLGGEHAISRERETPPTKFRDDVRFNLCADLTQKDGVAEKDQVSSIDRLYAGSVSSLVVLRSPFPLFSCC